MAKRTKGSARRQRSVDAKARAGASPVHQRVRGAALSFAVLACLSLLVFAAYGNSLSAGFVFDDHPIIEENPAIRSLAGVPSLFATGYWDREGYETDRLYRPLVMATYALNYAMSGLNPFIYHLTNLILHLAVCWTLYLLGRRLGLATVAAFAAAAVFAVHPINSEAVAGVVGRAELMMALGVLLALAFDLERNPLDQPASRLSIASTLAFCGALLSKEQAVMLPVLLLVLNGMRLAGAGATWQDEARRGAKRYLTWAAVVVAYLLLRYAVLGTLMPSEIGFVENPLAHTGLLTRVMTATKVAGYYLWLVLWPVPLSADYSYNAIPLVTSFFEPHMLLGALGWLALCVLGIVAVRRREVPLAAGISMAVLFFAPASNLITPIGTIMGERLFYLPFAGICLAAGAGVERLKRAGARQPAWMRWAEVGGASLLVVVLAARTNARSRDWETDFELFQSAVTVNPDAAKSHLMLGAWLAREGRTAESIAAMERAAAIYPDYRLRHTFAEEMGNMLLDSGRTDEAAALVERALAAAPDHPSLLHLYGRALQEKAQWEAAIATHRRALEVTREVEGENTVLFVNGLYHLSRAYTFQGRYAEAGELLDQAMQIIDTSLAESVGPRDVARFVSLRAILFGMDADYAAAAPLFDRLLSLIEASARPEDFRFLAPPLASYAEYLRATNREAEAGRVVRQIERISD